ncbi:MAG: ankyrin repeat domain-containing protein, partial [Limisphaerales bacterium]
MRDSSSDRKSAVWVSCHFCSLTLAAALLIALVDTSRADNAPLADAAEANDLVRITKLLQGEPNINARQVDGMIALHWAVYHDNTKLGKELLKRGADHSDRNRYGITPLHLACLNGNGELVEALLAAGADPNDAIPGGATALMTA